MVRNGLVNVTGYRDLAFFLCSKSVLCSASWSFLSASVAKLTAAATAISAQDVSMGCSVGPKESVVPLPLHCTAPNQPGMSI